MIAIKNEGNRARVRGLQVEALLAIQIAYSIWTDLSLVADMVITSACETGDFRKKGSKHLSGYAFDLRTRNLVGSQLNKFAESLRIALGSGYDVVVESNHIHVEYDPEP